MPSNLVKSYAKKSGKSVASVESAWKKAKRAVSKSYDPETNPNAFYGTVNKILRRKLNLEGKRTAKRFDMHRMNESAYEETIVQAIGKYFDYSLDLKFQDVVKDIVESALEDIEGRKREDGVGADQIYATDAVANALGEQLIYYKEQWAVLHHYCTPQNANWERAEETLFGDVLNIVSELLEDDAEDEEPEDEE